MLNSSSVANHMGNQNNGDWNNFSFFSPFDQAQYYHSYCLITDFNNQTEVHIYSFTHYSSLFSSCTFTVD